MSTALKTNINQNIRQQTLPDAITPDVLADQLDEMVDEIQGIIPFNQSIPFNKLITVMQTHTVTTNITLTPLTASAVPGFQSIVKIIANGINTVDITTFRQTTGSNGFINTNGVLNILQFLYDGTYYWVSIFQEQSAIPEDNIAPTSTQRSIANATRNKIDIQFSETVKVAMPAPSSITAVGSVTGAQVATDLLRSFADIVTATFTNNWLSGETVTVSYVQQNSSNDIQDLAGNKVANFSNLSVTNNIIGSVMQFVPSNWTVQNSGFKGNSATSGQDTAFSAQAIANGHHFILRDALTNGNDQGILFGLAANPRANGTNADIGWPVVIQKPNNGTDLIVNGAAVSTHARGNYYKITNESEVYKLYKSTDGSTWGSSIATIVSNPGFPVYVMINLADLSAVENLQYV